MPISYAQALTELSSGAYTTVESIFRLVESISGEVAGANASTVYLLYSGSVRGEYASSIASDVVQSGGGVGVIQSDVGRFVRLAETEDGNAFRAALRRALQMEIMPDLSGSPTPEQASRLANRFQEVMYGKGPDGTRITSNSLFDIASRKFVESARGSVRIIAGGVIDPRSVFAQTEFPALYSTSLVSDVDGVPLSELRKLAPQEALVRVNLRAAETAHFTSLGPGKVDVWMQSNASLLDSAAKDPALLADWARRQQQEFHTAEFRTASGWLADLYKRIDSIPGATRLLKSFGPISLATSFLFAADDAKAAQAAGDTERAKSIMAEWAVENAGSEIGSAIGATLGALAVGVAAVAGATIGAPFAAVIVFGAAIAGGFFGGEGGKEFYRLLDDSDQNGKRDILDRLTLLLFGATGTAGSPLPADLDGDKFSIDASLSRDEIVAHAKDSIAWRYALRELNPFVIADVSYAAHNTNSSLDVVDPATGTGSMSDLYLADRAAMLGWKIRWDRVGASDDNDGNRRSQGRKSYTDDWDTNEVVGNWDFVDLSPKNKLEGGVPLTLAIDGAGLSLHDHQIVFGSSAGELISGEGDTDHLYGMAGDDTLQGKGGDDYLEGGLGADRLEGGEGNDSLVGGRGLDTYQFTSNWGRDVIDDSDGQGAVVVDGYGTITGDGVAKITEGVWQSTDGRLTYSLVPINATRNDLVIKFSDRPDSLLIRNWQEGRLGIRLNGTAVTPELPSPLTGDFIKRTNVDGVTYTRQPNGNYVSNGSQPGAADLISGTAAGDRILGLGGHDGLAGSAGDDSIEGGDGNDAIFGGAGRDTLMGGEGNDLIMGSYNPRFVFPTRTDTPPPVALGPNEWTRGLSWLVERGGGTIRLAGMSPDIVIDTGDLIDGGAGDDFIAAGIGKDVIRGGTGNDHAAGLHGDDIAFGDDGNDTLIGDNTIDALNMAVPVESQGNDFLSGGAGADMLIGTGGNDTLVGGTGNDTLAGDFDGAKEALVHLPALAHGHDYLDGGEGDDWLVGGGGNDELFGGDDNDLLEGDAVEDTTPGIFGNDRLFGEKGNDRLKGDGGDDVLSGGDGNDSLWGDIDKREGALRQGRDWLDGGEGNDQLVGGGMDDVLMGGAGRDLLLGDDSESMVAANLHGADALNGEGGDDLIIGGGGNDALTGGEGDDELQGDAVSSRLSSAAHGNDRLDGGAGNDLLFGQGGNDDLRGGEGNDELQGDASSSDLAAESHGSDTLDGGAGNDRLIGGGGADTLYGGDGNDLMSGDAEVADLAVTFHGNDVLDGGDGDDSMVGGGGNDSLRGGAGNDQLRGDVQGSSTAPGGADTLDGGDGNDGIDGQDGADVITGGTGDDSLWGGAGNDNISGDAGNDYVFGGAGNDTLSGGDGNDVLLSGGGADVMSGGAGDDIFWLDFSSGPQQVSDAAGFNRVGVLDPGGATGWLYTLPSGTFTFVSEADMTRQLSNRALWLPQLGGLLSGGPSIAPSQAPTDGTSAEGTQFLGYADESNNRVTGTDTSDSLSGLGGDDRLIGYDGNDYLNGGNGNDRVEGGRGNDNLLSGRGKDTLIGGSGNDRLEAWDDKAWDADGGSVWNDLGVYMEGNSGDDMLVGGLGDDTLDGGTGNDVLMDTFDGTNTFLFGRGDGDDTIEANGFQTASRGILVFKEDVSVSDVRINSDVNRNNDVTLSLIGTADRIHLKGYYEQTDPAGDEVSIHEIRFADGTVWGLAEIFAKLTHATPGNDRISGSPNADTVSGEGGDDELFGGWGSDLILGGDGNDRIEADPTWADAPRTDGHDTIDGGAGADRIDGGSGNNTYLFGRGDGQDWIDRTGSRDVAGRTGTLSFKSGVNAADIALSIVDRSLRFSVAGTADHVDVDAFFESSTAVQNVRFADGTTWTRAQVLTRAFSGTPDDDNYGGSELSDTITGGGGNDMLSGWHGNDRISGDDGNDFVSGNAGADTLLGGAGSDTVWGDEGNDSLEGGSGNDMLDGGSGADRMAGGSGDDVYVVDSTGDIVTELANEGVDGVESSVSYTLGANVENLTLTQSGSGTGNTLANVITGSGGDDTLTGGQGSDSIRGGWGSNTYVFNRGDGQDIIDDLGEASEADTLRLGSGIVASDLVVIRSGNDLIVQLRGTSDRVTFARHFDAAQTQDGYTEDRALDRIVFSSGALWTRAQIDAAVSQSSGNLAPTVAMPLADSGGTIGAPLNIVVPAGTFTDPNAGDPLIYSATLVGGGALPAWLTFNSVEPSFAGTPPSGSNGTLNIRVTARDPGNLSVFDDFTLTIGAAVSNQTLNGTSGNDALAGGAGNDSISGLSGNDTLTGNGGSDTIDGGAGIDSMIGGAGDDMYYVDSYTDTVVEQTGGGVDTVISSTYYTLSAEIENLTLTGTASAGTGNALNNVVTGNALANTLNGGSGSDTLIGGAGNDTYVVDSSSDVIVELANSGTDLVQSSGSHTLASEVENLALTGGAAINATGNALANVITGNSAANQIEGLAGNDTLDGGLGNDVYVFGRGDGRDTIVEATADTASGKTNVLRLRTGIAQTDVTVARVGTTLEVRINGTSDAVVVTDFYLNDAPTNSRNPIQRIEFTDAGAVWDLAAIQQRVNAAANAAPVVAAPIADANGTTGTAVNITVPTGAFTDPNAGDVLTYSATLANGTALPSWLAFNASTRAFTGTPPIGSAGTLSIRVIARDTGNLSVYDDFNLTITAAVTNQTLTGTSGNDNLSGGTGNDSISGLAGNDTLTGNAGNDTIDGGAGIDSMNGGAGDDTYYVDNYSDAIVEQASGGTDSVFSSTYYTLGAEIENLTLTGSANAGTGNALNNTITGNASANTLNGLGGTDTLIGGAGNDIYVTDWTTDVIVEQAGGGIDLIQANGHGVLQAEVENLTLLGTTATNATGNTMANVITGNSAGNQIEGLAGNDTLDGGLGNDVYLFSRGDGRDTIAEATADTASGKANVLRFRAGVAQADVSVVRVGTTLEVRINGTTDAIVVTDFFLNDAPTNSRNPIQRIEFTDGGSWDLAAIQQRVNAATNSAPTVAAPIADANATIGTAANITVPTGAFTDPNAGDVLTYTATLANGTALPSWLTFNASTRAFTGTPPTGSNGTLSIRVTARDTGNLSAFDDFNLTIAAAPAAGQTLTGTSANNTLTGGSGNDSISGLAGNDMLTGNAGNDTLDGGAGVDSMIGGAGDDTYYVDVNTDVIVEAAGGGTDTVYSSTYYTLSAEIENLVLTGSATAGTGNGLANTITGNAAANTLNGSSGIDTLIGGAGNDTYVVDSSADVVTELAGGGTDLVQAYYSHYTLSNEVENLTLMGTAAINGTGNTGANTITGNTAANTIAGLAGNDTLIGGAGNDTYLMARGHGTDLIQENDTTANNRDIVQFQTDIASDQLWFARSGNDLNVTVIGTSDQIRVQNWYLGNAYHVEQFKASDSKTLSDNNVQNLVNAMAAFSPPSAGQTTLPANQQSALAGVLAANWT